jgi:isoquinoline 1-oxidoreductase beta subunit
MTVLSPTHLTCPSERDAATFFRECFIDELARAAWRDPVQYRRELLADSPRLRSVLDEAARAAGWGRPLPEGHARGIALSVTQGVVAAHVAELSLDDEGASQLHRIVAVVDCGATETGALPARWLSAGLAPAMANAAAALMARRRLEEGAWS